MEKKLTKAQKKDRRNRELCKLVKKNDLYAETRLLMENEGLIVQLASSMEIIYDLDINRWGGIEKEDIIQEGRIAMLRAAQRYDVDGDTKFSTFAYKVMKNAMKDLCKKGVSALENRMVESGMVQVFLDDDYSDDEYEVGVSDTIKADDEFDPTAKLAVLHVMLQKMHNRLHMLPEREQRILAYHYGLGELACRTISEAAAHFYFTEKYISEIEANALATLRDGMNDGKII